MPNGFPYHRHSSKRQSFDIKRVDIIGACIMIAAITLIITAFEQVSNFVPWVSAKVLAPLLISILAMVVFLVYERSITLQSTEHPEPVFPWRFCQSRVMMGLLM